MFIVPGYKKYLYVWQGTHGPNETISKPKTH